MKILAYTSPARGHLFPLVPILDELTTRGHHVAVRTLAFVVGQVGLRMLERAWKPLFNPMRVAAVARPFASADETWTAPPLVLYLTVEPFEYSRTWPDSSKLVGPCA